MKIGNPPKNQPILGRKPIKFKNPRRKKPNLAGKPKKIINPEKKRMESGWEKGVQRDEFMDEISDI